MVRSNSSQGLAVCSGSGSGPPPPVTLNASAPHFPRRPRHAVIRKLARLLAPASRSRPESGTPLASLEILAKGEFDRVLRRERARADRSGATLSMLQADLRVANWDPDARVRSLRALAARVRCTDAVGWLEEHTLAVLLPDTSPEGAQHLLEEIRFRVLESGQSIRWRILSYPDSPPTDGTSGSDREAKLTSERAGTGLVQPGSSRASETENRVSVVRAAAEARGPRSGLESDVDQTWRTAPFATRPPRPGLALKSRPSAARPTAHSRSDSRQMRRSSPMPRAASRAGPRVEPLRDVFLVPVSPSKRCLDVLGAATALVLLSPVMIAAAAAIKLTSPGPVFFRQQRSGLGGRTFSFYKFRSMTSDAEVRKQELLALNEQSGPVFKLRSDPRITPIGRLLRKTSVDELPQLWNVLRGDMSLVGPRPPIALEVREYEPWQRRRLEIQGGLTCIWQVSGRSSIQFADWVRLDLRYVETASIWTDFRILLKTVPAVLSCRGAH